MALSAVIFDVDGTLIDTNDAHVEAWDRALKAHHYKVSPDRIAVEIGKGGDKLIPSILGQEIEKKDGESLRRAHTAEYLKIAESTRLSVFPGTEALVAELRRRGLRLAIATSSKKDELEKTTKSARIDLEALFDVVANGEDAQESKPAPAILQAAVRKLKLSPAECMMIGDTPYDADSARDAGVVCLGLTCGGMNDAKTLHATGMRKVYRDPADVLAHLDEAIQITSPGKIVLTQDILEALMRQALETAAQALEHGEVPIGCVIASGDGQIIARAHNELNASQDKIAHAEIVAFRRIAGKVAPETRDLILACTLEPCVMCLGASMEAAVDTIAYGLAAPADGGRIRVRPPTSPESQMPRIVGNILGDESRKLLQEFLARSPKNPAQVKFVKDLLTRVDDE